MCLLNIRVSISHMHSFLVLSHVCVHDIVRTMLINQFTFYTDCNAEVLVWFDAGCSCSYSVNEQSGSLEVCARILFINGTELTTSDYTVTISADTTSASAQSKKSSILSRLLKSRFCFIIIIIYNLVLGNIRLVGSH